jgi:dihydroneopterin aldolase
MTDRIRISGIEARAKHGVLDIEKSQDQLFFVDLEITLDLSDAAASDQLGRTIDYGELAQRTHDFVMANSFNLIERVADGIAGLVMEYPAALAVEVTVHKPNAPISVPFRDVSVTIGRGR